MTCLPVVIEANYCRQKVFLAVRDGLREGEQSREELLLELRERGLQTDPKFAIGDGALGFCRAFAQFYPET